MLNTQVTRALLSELYHGYHNGHEHGLDLIEVSDQFTVGYLIA